VTTIVDLRAYAASSNILPEQTLGRGLRRMYFGADARETVSVLGTPAFMEFVESILPDCRSNRSRRVKYACKERHHRAVVSRPASLMQSERQYRFVYVDQAGFEKNRVQDFAVLVAAFSEYQPSAQLGAATTAGASGMARDG